MTSTEDLPVGVITVLAVVAFLGFISNVMVCLVIAYTPNMKSVTSLFMVNLAISDILYSSISLPMKLVSMVNTNYWPLGNVGCKIVMFTPLFCITSSIYTMVAISYERRVAILKAANEKITIKQAKIAILVIWSLSLASSAPQIYEYSAYEKVVLHLGSSSEESGLGDAWNGANLTAGKLATGSDAHEETDEGILPLAGGGSSEEIALPENFTDFHLTMACGSKGIVEMFEETYSVCIFVVGYLIPLVIISVNYLLLARFIFERSAGSTGSAVSKKKIKVVKMLIVVVIVFAVCWAPFFALFVREEVLGLDDSAESASALHSLKLMLAILSTVSNPIIYVTFNSQFRQGFQRLLCCKLGRNNQVGSLGRSTAQTNLSQQNKQNAAPPEVNI